MPLLTIEEASRIIQSFVPKQNAVQCALSSACGLVAADEIQSKDPLPLFTNSAMDGYAVHWNDVQATEPGTPVRLSIVGESKAGEPFGAAVERNAAVRISTGAMLPAQADTVIPQEDTDIEGETVLIRQVKRSGANVRFEGEELPPGSIILQKGTLITAAHIALLASLGITAIPVFRQPRVSIIVTGSELRPFDQAGALPTGHIRDSNGPMLAALVEQAGGELRTLRTIGDSAPDHTEALESALAGSDIIIFSGGVSVGPHDHVRPAALAAGFRQQLWGVAQKPGKPLFVATRGESLLFGLPGNPVSAYMCFVYYIKGLIRSCCGLDPHTEHAAGRLAEAITNSGNRAQMLRVRIEALEGKTSLVHPLARQGSHMLSSLSEADGFIIVEPGQSMPAGSVVSFTCF